MTCICIDVSRMFEHLPGWLYIVATLMLFLCGCCFIGGLMIALLECQLTRLLADFIRGEKRKRKNEELN